MSGLRASGATQIGCKAGEPDTATVVPGPLYGLRTWKVVGERGAERLSGPYAGTLWPDGGVWMQATCRLDGAHIAPVGDCTCGVYGWHPSRRSARRVLAVRREIAGIVETRGAVEVHVDGFRAQEARPYALVVHRRSNPHLARRLGLAYGTRIIETRDANALLTWCRERDLGLGDAGVRALLGP